MPFLINHDLVIIQGHRNRCLCLRFYYYIPATKLRSWFTESLKVSSIVCTVMLPAIDFFPELRSLKMILISDHQASDIHSYGDVLSPAFIGYNSVAPTPDSSNVQFLWWCRYRVYNCSLTRVEPADRITAVWRVNTVNKFFMAVILSVRMN